VVVVRAVLVVGLVVVVRAVFCMDKIIQLQQEHPLIPQLVPEVPALHLLPPQETMEWHLHLDRLRQVVVAVVLDMVGLKVI
jgi:hypothetical protein